MFFNNINRIKEAEIKLQESEARFRSLFEGMTIGVVYQNVDGKITDANPAAEKILGLSRDQLLGRISADPRWKAMDEKGQDLSGDQHPAMLAFRSGKAIKGSVMRIFNPQEDSYRWLLVDAVPQYRPGESQPFQVYALFQDITDRQEAVLEKEEVLRIVTHDLRNPLTSAIVGAEYLEKHLAAELSKKPEALQIVQRSLNRASKLIEDLLDVIKLEAGQLTLDKQAVSIQDILNEVEHSQRSVVQAAKIGFQIQTLPGLFPQEKVWVDLSRLLQVFENLVGNAIKFTPEGGEITVSAQRRDDHVQFGVSDNGSGIPVDQQEHLFEKFWQLKGNHAGAGLGLSIVKGILDKHQGKVWVESRENQGSAFYFTLLLVN
ncbi:MAG: PAS domain S-box protein [Bacteroidia bacterium]|nr:PAS domain S-box protein [Bacteroidia bacterium]